MTFDIMTMTVEERAALHASLGNQVKLDQEVVKKVEQERVLAEFEANKGMLISILQDAIRGNRDAFVNAFRGTHARQIVISLDNDNVVVEPMLAHKTVKTPKGDQATSTVRLVAVDRAATYKALVADGLVSVDEQREVSQVKGDNSKTWAETEKVFKRLNAGQSTARNNQVPGSEYAAHVVSK